jgi:hypothetical protein
MTLAARRPGRRWGLLRRPPSPEVSVHRRGAHVNDFFRLLPGRDTIHERQHPGIRIAPVRRGGKVVHQGVLRRKTGKCRRVVEVSHHRGDAQVSEAPCALRRADKGEHRDAVLPPQPRHPEADVSAPDEENPIHSVPPNPFFAPTRPLVYRLVNSLTHRERRCAAPCFGARLRMGGDTPVFLGE